MSLARALETTVDELLAEAESGDDVVIRPTRDVVHGATHWLLTRHDDPLRADRGQDALSGEEGTTATAGPPG